MDLRALGRARGTSENSKNPKYIYLESYFPSYTSLEIPIHSAGLKCGGHSAIYISPFSSKYFCFLPATHSVGDFTNFNWGF